MSAICQGRSLRAAVRRVLLAALLAGAIAAHASAAQAHLDVPIVVTQLVAGTDLEKQAPYSGGMLRAPYGDGARLLLVSPDGATRVLSEGLHSACDPDVSFDGKRILLAGKRTANEPWSIFEMAVDGSGVRQITRGSQDCRQPGWQSTLFTITASEPWRQITFVSTPDGAVNECGGAPATSLYSCRLDGSEVRRLTYNLSSDLDPAILADGRLLLASWQRSTLDHGPLGRIGLFAIQVDGMDAAAFCLGVGKRVKHMPCATTRGLAVFVETDQAPWDGAGTLACTELRRPLHTYRALTAESDGLFHTPSALPDGTILVSRRPADGSGTLGVWRLDPASKRRDLVFDDPRRHEIQAKAVSPRAEPDGRSSVIKADDPWGKLFCLDVRQSDLKGWGRLPPGTAKRLRVLEGVPRKAGETSAAAGGAALLALRRVLGEVQIEADGSFNVRVPAGTALELQVLDADGLALGRCGWIWAMHHEPRGCIGCHEDPELTPPNVLVSAVAVPSVPVALAPGQRPSVDFCRDLAPILARACAPCHAQGGSPPLLDTGTAPASGPGDAAARLYETLLATEAAVASGGPRGKYVDPGRARTSPLVWHLLGRNTSRPWDGAAAERKAKPIPPDPAVPLGDADRQAFIQWIDTGAPWQAAPQPSEAFPDRGDKGE